MKLLTSLWNDPEKNFQAKTPLNNNSCKKWKRGKTEKKIQREVNVHQTYLNVK